MAGKIVALIPAAGKGERLGLGPKPLLRLGRRALIEIVLDTLEPLVDGVRITVPRDHLERFQALVGEYRDHAARLCCGYRARARCLDAIRVALPLWRSARSRGTGRGCGRFPGAGVAGGIRIGWAGGVQMVARACQVVSVSSGFLGFVPGVAEGVVCRRGLRVHCGQGDQGRGCDDRSAWPRREHQDYDTAGLVDRTDGLGPMLGMT